MAEIPFSPVDWQASGSMYKAEGLATGDTTSVLTLNNGDNDVGIHIYGAIGGATVVVGGGINSAVASFATMDDAYGLAMSYTALPVIKPLGPAARQVRVVVSGGAGTGITVDVFIPHRRG